MTAGGRENTRAAVRNLSVRSLQRVSAMHRLAAMLMLLSAACARVAPDTGADGDAGANGRDSEATEDSADGGDRLTALCHEYAATSCREFATCASFWERVMFGDEAECRGMREQECRVGNSLSGVADAVPSLERCISELHAGPCGSLWTAADACFWDRAGTLPDGARCAAPTQCASGACTDFAFTTLCGTCGAAATEGTPCSHDFECVTAGPSSLYCDGRSCVAGRESGASCSLDNECAHPLACRGGICQEREGNVGAPCDSDRDCDYFTGVYCDVAMGRCAQLRVAGAGEACGVGTACRGQTFCDEYRLNATNTCIPRSALGEQCIPPPSAGIGLVSCVRRDGVLRCVSRAELCQ
jgi:hypothetical protein